MFYNMLRHLLGQKFTVEYPSPVQTKISKQVNILIYNVFQIQYSTSHAEKINQSTLSGMGHNILLLNDSIERPHLWVRVDNFFYTN